MQKNTGHSVNMWLFLEHYTLLKIIFLTKKKKLQILYIFGFILEGSTLFNNLEKVIYLQDFQYFFFIRKIIFSMPMKSIGPVWQVDIKKWFSVSTMLNTLYFERSKCIGIRKTLMVVQNVKFVLSTNFKEYFNKIWRSCWKVWRSCCKEIHMTQWSSYKIKFLEHLYPCGQTASE